MGPKKEGQEAVWGGHFGVQDGVRIAKIRSERPLEKVCYFMTTKTWRKACRETPGNGRPGPKRIPSRETLRGFPWENSLQGEIPRFSQGGIAEEEFLKGPTREGDICFENFRVDIVASLRRPPRQARWRGYIYIYIYLLRCPCGSQRPHMILGNFTFMCYKIFC